MMAATSPAFTVRFRPRMISVPSSTMRACRFLISSIVLFSEIVVVSDRIVGVSALQRLEPPEGQAEADGKDGDAYEQIDEGRQKDPGKGHGNSRAGVFR